MIEFPLFERKDYLCVRNGRLFGSFGIDNRQTWKLLTDKAVEKEIESCKGKPVTGNQVKRALAKELIKQYPEQTAPVEVKRIQIETPSYDISYDISLDQADVSEESNFIRYRNNIAILSPNGRTYLYALAQGDTNKLDDIAELLARLYLRDRPSKYLWVIFSGENEVSFFPRLFLIWVRMCLVTRSIKRDRIRKSGS